MNYLQLEPNMHEILGKFKTPYQTEIQTLSLLQYPKIPPSSRILDSNIQKYCRQKKNTKSNNLACANVCEESRTHTTPPPPSYLYRSDQECFPLRDSQNIIFRKITDAQLQNYYQLVPNMSEVKRNFIKSLTDPTRKLYPY